MSLLVLALALFLPLACVNASDDDDDDDDNADEFTDADVAECEAEVYDDCPDGADEYENPQCYRWLLSCSECGCHVTDCSTMTGEPSQSECPYLRDDV
ncbi:MAG: hypothetical protein M5R36_24110 [Deltaproteobacteria bacterium]|nr:hypothetical protein [Deltaproteobacteria bacterium]